MSVHYKFKSGKEAHTITFDSVHISVGELKKAIMQQRKIGKSADLDLQITNAQTKEVYESDSALIPKNTSVIVARVPVANSKKSWSKNDSSRHDKVNDYAEDKPQKNSNMANSSEDDKIKEMLTQSTKDYDPSKYARGKGPLGPLPPNYTCYRCGKPGHYIKHCPTNSIDVKRSTGIPRSFMIPAKADQKGAMITASGEYAVPIIDHDAYKEVKKEKPPFFPTENEPEIQKIEIPEDLKCTLCKNLLQDAVLIPCCGNSACDECIRLLLLDSDNHECPSCHETNVSPDNLIPNRFLRLSVIKFKNETGFGNRLAVEQKTESSGQVKVENASSENLKEEENLKTEGDSNKPPEDDDNNESGKKDNDGDDLYESIDNQDTRRNELKRDSSCDNTEDDNERTNTGIDESSSENAEQDLSGENTQSISAINSFQGTMSNTTSNRFIRNPIRVRSSGQPSLFPRPPGQMMVPQRGHYGQNRPLLPHDAAFFNDPLQQYPSMPLPVSYGYGSHMRHGNMFDQGMYRNRSGQLNSLMPYQNNLATMGSLNGDNSYYPYKYDDYEDQVERFNRHLEFRSRRHTRRYSRSRSPQATGHRSRSRSVSVSSRSSSHSRSRHHSHSRYPRERRERSHSNSPHRFTKSSHARHRRSRSHSKAKYDRRERSRDRSDRDRRHKSSKRDADVYRISAEDANWSYEKLHENKFELTKETEVKEESHVEQTSVSLTTNLDNDWTVIDETNSTSQGANQEVLDQPATYCISFGDDNTQAEEKDFKENEIVETSPKNSKDKPSKGHSKSRKSRSYSSDSSCESKSRKRKKNKKSSKESNKSRSSDKHGNGHSKSKSKHDSKSSLPDENKSKNNKSASSSSSKHSSRNDKNKRSKDSEQKHTENVQSRTEEDKLSSYKFQSPKLGSDGTLSKLALDSLANMSLETGDKSDEIEIKIQEDYSDLESEDVLKLDKNTSKELNDLHQNNKENVNKAQESTSSKESKSSSGDELGRKVMITSSKSSEKPLLSVTIENKVKIGSKINFTDPEGDKSRNRDKDRKSDRSKERRKEKEQREGDERHKEHSSHKSSGDSSKSSRSKDRKKDDSHRSKRSHHHRSWSRSASHSPRKRLKSKIDSSTSSSHHKSSKSYRSK